MILETMARTLPTGDRDKLTDLVHQALAEGLPAETIVNDGLIPGMDEVGRLFQSGEFFIPHMLIAARAMKEAMAVLGPILSETGVEPVAKVVLGTVKGDHHDIGKNLVRIMLEGKGFEVIDIGIDRPPEEFVEAVSDEVRIVGMSALLTTTAPFMGETIEALDKAGRLGEVRTMVGGGAVRPEFAHQIGADAYGPDAATAADLALSLVKT